MNDAGYLIAPMALGGFVIIWCAVNLLLGSVSGWRSLARRYRGRLPEVTASVGMASGMMRWTSYKSVLRVQVGPYGVGLSLFPLFAVGSPPLAIPWEALSGGALTRQMGMFDRFAFTIDGHVDVVLGGAAARLMAQAWPARAEMAPTVAVSR